MRKQEDNGRLSHLGAMSGDFFLASNPINSRTLQVQRAHLLASTAVNVANGREVLCNFLNFPSQVEHRFNVLAPKLSPRAPSATGGDYKHQTNSKICERS